MDERVNVSKAAEFLPPQRSNTPLPTLRMEFRSENLADGVFAHGEHDGIIFCFKVAR
jgi:hypothetical protein